MGFLDKYTTPSFGHLPKREIDLLVLEAMVQVGRISPEPEISELITELRVTRAKARSLLYDRDLRRLDRARLDEMLNEALKRPLIQKQGDTFVLEIENPYLQDHLKAILRREGHVTDGSFGAGLVRLNAAALSAVVVHGIQENRQEAVRKALVEAGVVADKSLKGVLTGALMALGRKVASDVGEDLAGELGGLIGDLLGGAGNGIKRSWGKVLAEK